MRLKLTLAYVGTAYAGWQRQPDEPTVQGHLEAAFARVANRPVAVTGAGRTDSGVHASGQVAHADTGASALTPEAWQRALNANLPADIRVVASEQPPDGFHARYGARRKTYRYWIEQSPVASPFLAPFAWHIGRPLDLDAMRIAARALAGDIDQRTFATRPEDGERPRPLDSVAVAHDRLTVVTVTGRSFLRYAVRGMVGTLVDVGLGRRQADAMFALARSGDRAAAGQTAPPHGLCLASVRYETRPTAIR